MPKAQQELVRYTSRRRTALARSTYVPLYYLRNPTDGPTRSSSPSSDAPSWRSATRSMAPSGRRCLRSRNGDNEAGSLSCRTRRIRVNRSRTGRNLSQSDLLPDLDRAERQRTFTECAISDHLRTWLVYSSVLSWRLAQASGRARRLLLKSVRETGAARAMDMDYKRA
jgi:hypothetical protein